MFLPAGPGAHLPFFSGSDDPAMSLPASLGAHPSFFSGSGDPAMFLPVGPGAHPPFFSGSGDPAMFLPAGPGAHLPFISGSDDPAMFLPAGPSARPPFFSGAGDPAVLCPRGPGARQPFLCGVGELAILWPFLCYPATSWLAVQHGAHLPFCSRTIADPIPMSIGCNHGTGFFSAVSTDLLLTHAAILVPFCQRQSWARRLMSQHQRRQLRERRWSSGDKKPQVMLLPPLYHLITVGLDKVGELNAAWHKLVLPIRNQYRKIE
uniref:Uncharacterized protein n=1 Tax=Leersia perrieri TaxID=77586 RepID=A0A0D9VKF1_9ORYZ